MLSCIGCVLFKSQKHSSSELHFLQSYMETPTPDTTLYFFLSYDFATPVQIKTNTRIDENEMEKIPERHKLWKPTQKEIKLEYIL